VSSGGLDQFLDVVPLNVEEGGVAVVRLNTSGVVYFLEAHADMETAPVILMQLLASPEHGEVRVLDDKNVTTVTQQQLDAGEVCSFSQMLTATYVILNYTDTIVTQNSTKANLYNIASCTTNY
jgi:hypothetical protein